MSLNSMLEIESSARSIIPTSRKMSIMINISLPFLLYLFLLQMQQKSEIYCVCLFLHETDKLLLPLPNKRSRSTKYYNFVAYLVRLLRLADWLNKR